MNKDRIEPRLQRCADCKFGAVMRGPKITIADAPNHPITIINIQRNCFGFFDRVVAGALDEVGEKVGIEIPKMYRRKVKFYETCVKEGKFFPNHKK